MKDDERLIAIPSQTVGPFFHFGLATNTALGRIAPGNESAERMALRVCVLDGDGTPVPDALVEVYHADATGAYPASPSERGGFTGFGRLPTDAEGVCTFQTIRPGRVESSAPHITVCILARGLLRHVYTRIYFSGDSGLDADPILALVPADRRSTLMATRVAGTADAWAFVIRLQGDRETVFFDL